MCLIVLAIVLLLPNFFTASLFSESTYNQRETYDPHLAYINSLEKLQSHLDSAAGSKQLAANSYEYVNELEAILRKRFYHGYAHFKLRQNWIASITGKLIDSGMACKVHPAKILQQNNAACSQQVAVMMAILKANGYTYRSLGFPHHYALEVKVAGQWYFFDPSMEPVITREQRSEGYWQYHTDSLKQYYPQYSSAIVEYIFGSGLTAVKGNVNAIPAPNARKYQTTTGILSKIGWCCPLLLLLISIKKMPSKSSVG